LVISRWSLVVSRWLIPMLHSIFTHPHPQQA
jgi:hypothetical protein